MIKRNVDGRMFKVTIVTGPPDNNYKIDLGEK